MSSKKVLELKVKTVGKKYWFNATVDGYKYTFINPESLQWQLDEYGFSDDDQATIWDSLFFHENIKIVIPEKKVS